MGRGLKVCVFMTGSKVAMPALVTLALDVFHDI
jgi:hypothetical protein